MSLDMTSKDDRIMKTKVGAVGIIITTSIAISSSGNSSNSTTI